MASELSSKIDDEIKKSRHHISDCSELRQNIQVQPLQRQLTYEISSLPPKVRQNPYCNFRQISNR